MPDLASISDGLSKNNQPVIMTRQRIIESYLREQAGLNFDRLQIASEDASFRRYFRIQTDEKSYVVMDAPPDKEPCDTFIAITQLLEASRINVPHIYHQDTTQGILVLADFGGTSYLDVLDEQSANRLYTKAIQSLVDMQSVPASEDLPAYSKTMLSNEMQLFDEWLLGGFLNIKLSSNEKSQLEIVYEHLLENALSQVQVFVHRDYHSRNLMYYEAQYPGIIDYQDAVVGPITYDLVSLLKDCYIKWPESKRQEWINEYLDQTTLLNGDRDFQRQFDLMGVQRHLKASGIFARLSLRDGKQGFLDDIPRTLSYITDLKDRYSELGPLIHLLEDRVLPRLKQKVSSCTR